MAEEYLKIEITTPHKQWMFEEAISCSAPGTLGRFQVLVHHAPLMSQLEIGELKIELPDGVRYFSLSGGFLEVKQNRVILLLETCEAAEEIDVERAERALQRAKKRLQERPPGLDVIRAEAALARAMNRLKVAKKISQPA
ncbi:MAG: F0F1 ATP synthase subunit epsilon [Calditrichaeota bacterium]|nr:F0F1 ATP synthase subunit epsilon [Calditrichota bacterium]